MRLRISKIKERAKDRPPGYVEAVLSRGVIDGDFLEISNEALDDLRVTYRPPEQAIPTASQAQAKRGLGDIVAMVATPIARALKLPCIDPATQNLRPDSPCARRKAWLNGGPGA